MDTREPSEVLRGKKYLFVASTGGHLAQLRVIANAIPHTPDSLWVTFPSPQSRSLLADRRTLYVPYVKPRDLGATLHAARLLHPVIKNEHFDGVITTGAAVALSALVPARMLRVPGLYIESVSRVEGPSLTGRIVAGFHLAQTRTQHSEWANRTWRPGPSVLGLFTRVPTVEKKVERLFVTLGTIDGYRFDSVVDSVLSTGLANEDTIWQLGATTRRDLPGRVHIQVSSDEFETIAREADAIVSHAGVGSLMKLLELGRYPLLVPRRRERHEHVDDHQVQIARLAASMKIARVVEGPMVTRGTIEEAARWSVVEALGGTVPAGSWGAP